MQTPTFSEHFLATAWHMDTYAFLYSSYACKKGGLAAALVLKGDYWAFCSSREPAYSSAIWVVTDQVPQAWVPPW